MRTVSSTAVAQLTELTLIILCRVYQKRLGVCHGDELLYLFPFDPRGFPTPLKTDTGERKAETLDQTGVQ